MTSLNACRRLSNATSSGGRDTGAAPIDTSDTTLVTNLVTTDMQGTRKAPKLS